MARKSGPEAYPLRPTSDEQIDAYYDKDPGEQLPRISISTEQAASIPVTKLPIARVTNPAARQLDSSPTPRNLQPFIPAGLFPTNEVALPTATGIATLEAPLPDSAEPITAETRPYESKQASSHRILKVGGTLGALALVAGAGMYGYQHTFGGEQAPKQPLHAEAALVPGIAPDVAPTPGETLPTPATTLATPEGTTSSSTTEQSKQTPTTPKGPKIVLPLPLPTTPAATSISKSPDAPAKIPPSPTPEQSDSSSSTPSSESAPLIGTTPSKESANLLGSFADKDRVSDLKDNYQNVDDYLHAAKNGELDFLNTTTVKAFQDNLSQLYKNQSATQTLGTPPWLSADTLRTMRDSGSSPARQATEYTDNTLRSANTLFPLVGDLISKAAFCNNQLSDDLTQRLQNGEDVSRPDSSNQAIADDTERVNDIYVVPVVASYVTDKGTINLFSWDALVPIDTEGRFVPVTVWQQQLEPKDTNDNTYSTPPTPEPTDTSTPTDSANQSDYAQQNSNRHHHNHRH